MHDMEEFHPCYVFITQTLDFSILFKLDVLLFWQSIPFYNLNLSITWDANRPGHPCRVHHMCASVRQPAWIFIEACVCLESIHPRKTLLTGELRSATCPGKYLSFRRIKTAHYRVHSKTSAGPDFTPNLAATNASGEGNLQQQTG